MLMRWIVIKGLSPKPDKFCMILLKFRERRASTRKGRNASAGFKVAFTEVDLNVKIGDIDFNTEAGRVEYAKRLQWQAKYYAGLLKIALKNENVIVFHSWMVTVREPDISDSRFADYGNGAILDKNYNPEPAYEAMLELLINP